MKIQPIASPAAIQQAPSSTSADARQRAISMLMSDQPQTPVSNQTQMTVDDTMSLKVESSQQVSREDQQNHTEVTEDTLTPPDIPEPNISEQKQEDTPLSRQFAQLARQERQMRAKAQQQETALKAREQALAAREAELTTKDAQYKSGYIPKETLKNNPLQALLEAEVSYDELTQHILNNSNPLDPRVQTMLSKQEAQIAKLEATLAERDSQAKSSEQSQYDAAVKQIRTDATALVKNDPNYEAIRAKNAVKDVVELIEKTYNEDGVLLTVEEAADEVENYLLEEAVKLSQLGKVTKRLQSVAPKPTPKLEQTTSPQGKPTTQAQPMKTLTNAAASTRPLSARERALLAFKGQLK